METYIDVISVAIPMFLFYVHSVSKKRVNFETVQLKIIRIDFDDIWHKYSKYSRIEFLCFSFRVGLLFLSTFRLSNRSPMWNAEVVVWLFTTMNSYCVVHASAQTWGQNQWYVLSWCQFETDAASWHSCSICKQFFSRTVPHHIAPKTVALLDQETSDFIPPALWPPNSPNLNPVDQWPVSMECTSGVSRSYQDLGCQQSEITHQQWVGPILSHQISTRLAYMHLQFCIRAGGGHFEHTL